MAAYVRDCRFCGVQIRLSDVGDHWVAFDLATDGAHVCGSSGRGRQDDVRGYTNSARWVPEAISSNPSIAPIAAPPEVAAPAIDLALLAAFLEARGFEVVDKRAAGGALWVIDSTELSPTLRELDQRGIAFRCAENGGRSTGYRRAWWLVP